jgi:hypothetical protein
MTLPRWRAIYDRAAPVLVVFCLLASLFASVGTFVLARVNGEQDRRSDADKAALLKCFDHYAELQSSSSIAVREASVAKDEATTLRDDALNVEGLAFQRVVQELLEGNLTPASVKRLAESLAARSVASHRLDQAQNDLDEARAAHPVPAPPSQFCSVKP